MGFSFYILLIHASEQFFRYDDLSDAHWEVDIEMGLPFSW